MTRPERPSGRSAAGAETRRQLEVLGRDIEYTLRRSARRSLGLTIDGRGLRAAAPQRMAIGEVERFIRQHGTWVLRKLDEWRSRAATAHWEPTHGAKLPVLGADWRLEVESGRRTQACSAEGVIRLTAADPSHLRPALRRHLQGIAREHFGHRIAHFARALGTAPPPLRLSSARTRWGSFHPRSGVRLNWRLIHLPPHLIDYVVAHELAHGRELNHSPRFWAVVAGLYPDHLAARRELRQLAPSLPVL